MFIAYVQQNYEGCDYTIGCAQTLWRLKAKTRDEAIQELKLKIVGEWEPGEGWDDGYWDDGYWEEQALGKVVLFEVSSEEDAVKQIAKRQDEIKRLEKELVSFAPKTPKQLYGEFSILTNDTQRWEWILANQGGEFTFYLDNDTTTIVFEFGDSGGQVNLDKYVNGPGAEVLLDVMNINTGEV